MGEQQRPALAALAERVGILPEYVDQTGHERRVTSDETRVALLAAMGFDAADEQRARQALDELAAREAERLIAPTRVVQAGAGAERMAVALPVTVPAAWRGASWELTVTEESGAKHRAEGRAGPAATDGHFSLDLPAPLPLGYHRVRLTLRAERGERSATQTLIVTPPACPAPEAVLGGRRAYGITANLYAVRSARNWGAGDFTDLATLVELAAATGAAFVGVNPLHALRNDGGWVSPYSPVSRLFRNVLYIDVAAVPELAAAPDARELMQRPEFVAELARLRASPAVDYAAVMRLKRPVLERLHRRFREVASADRRADYEEYLASQGDALRDFATFVALAEHLARDGAAGSWREWPNEYQDPRSDAVARFRAEHADAVDFHRWLQFELDAQLAEAAQRGAELGLRVGLYQDLAIGTSDTSSDVWAFPDLFVSGVCVGAPPDSLGPQGQNWGLPPVDPRRLAEQGYAYWITLVRGALRHSGALRIDHALGLFRQFWIPSGMTGDYGAYVRYPTRDLLGILALESTRANALVVGEDLGTVPPEVAPTFAQWRVLSSKVFYFERREDGDFTPARAYPPMALATANTHDLATLAGYWRGRDIELRRAVGLLDAPGAEAQACADRARDREALLRALAAEGLVSATDPDAVDDLTLRAAVHTFLRRTPSWLVGLSLDDLVGETEPVNLPGVSSDRFSSWTRRLAMPLEQVMKSRKVRRAMGKAGGDRAV